MINNDIDAYLLQETLLTGDWEKEIRGYLVIHHNHDKDKKKKKKGREKRGVAIILSPYFRKAFEKAGKPKPITTDQKGIHSGRFIGISFHFPNFDSYGKKIKGHLNLFLASIYHPYETDKYQTFNSHLTSIMGRAPKRAEIILGQDINANIGVRDDEDDDFADCSTSPTSTPI